jgi:hypothetical protein
MEHLQMMMAVEYEKQIGGVVFTFGYGQLQTHILLNLEDAAILSGKLAGLSLTKEQRSELRRLATWHARGRQPLGRTLQALWHH